MFKKILALATFLGTVIGVGLFGLPYTASKIGFIPIIFYFIGLCLLAIIIHLLYGEVVLRTNGRHRLPGYAEIYLGKGWKLVSAISAIAGLTGAILAYIVIGGQFLTDLFEPIFGGNQIIFTLIYFASGILLIYLGTKSVSRTELIMIVLFFAIIILIFLRVLPQINYSFFSGFDLKYFFLPYGVILFSLWGASIIPEIKEILGKENEKSLKPILIFGVIIAAVTYLIFIFSVLGITGPATSPDALTALNLKLGNGTSTLMLFFGLLTTFTSYLTLGVTLKKIFWLDLKLNHFLSWLMVAIMPIVLYLAGIVNFIAIISFTGAVTLGFDTIIAIGCFFRAKKKGQRRPAYSLNLSKFGLTFFAGLLIIGIILEIIYLF